jgi:hypothetical protein
MQKCFVVRVGVFSEKLSKREKGGEYMQLTEQHVISSSDPRYTVIDEAAFKSKNLYNASNYVVRQAFPEGEQWRKQAIKRTLEKRYDTLCFLELYITACEMNR